MDQSCISCYKEEQLVSKLQTFSVSQATPQLMSRKLTQVLNLGLKSTTSLQGLS